MQLVGLDKLTNAFGIVCVFRGLSLMFGSPMAGLVYDHTRTYDASFALSAGLFLTAGSIGLVYSVVHAYRLKRKRDADRTYAMSNGKSLVDSGSSDNMKHVSKSAGALPALLEEDMSMDDAELKTLSKSDLDVRFQSDVLATLAEAPSPKLAHA